MMLDFVSQRLQGLLFNGSWAHKGLNNIDLLGYVEPKG